MAQGDLHLGFSSLIPVAHANLSADDLKPEGFFPGAITMGADKLGGFKMFKYSRTQQSGGQSKGELASRVANTGTITVTAATGEVNSTTRLNDTSKFTANNEVGKLCVILDDAGAAGAAPEGEVALVVGNTVTTLIFDADYPLSAAPAVGDTAETLAFNLHDDSADGDLAINVAGLVMADRSAGYYGWLQFYGYNPGAIYTTAAVDQGDPVVADTAAMLDYGSDAEHLWVGHCPIAVDAGLASPFRSLAFMDLMHMSQPVT